MITYYVAGIAADFWEVKDALYLAMTEARRTREEYTVMAIMPDGNHVAMAIVRA